MWNQKEYLLKKMDEGLKGAKNFNAVYVRDFIVVLTEDYGTEFVVAVYLKTKENDGVYIEAVHYEGEDGNDFYHGGFTLEDFILELDKVEKFIKNGKHLLKKHIFDYILEPEDLTYYPEYAMLEKVLGDAMAVTRSRISILEANGKL